MIEQDLQKRLVGQEILQGSDLLDEIHKVKQNNEQLIIELNTKYHSKKEVIKYLSDITGKPVDPSVDVSLPFYSDFGKHITFGKNIFINLNVTFVDLGGITIEDSVLIGPGARLVTVNHLVSPKKKMWTTCSPNLCEEKRLDWRKRDDIIRRNNRRKCYRCCGCYRHKRCPSKRYRRRKPSQTNS